MSKRSFLHAAPRVTFHLRKFAARSKPVYGGTGYCPLFTLWPRTEFAKDAGIPVGPPASGAFSLGHNVSSREAVDELLACASAAGATVIGEAHDRPWDIYSGYFRDPDGNLWEIAWNPELGQ